jgi:hypothetical protein
LDWLQWAGSLFVGWGWMALGLLAVGCAVVPLHRWIGRIMALAMVGTLIWTLIAAVRALPAAPDSEAAHSLIETLTQWMYAWGERLAEPKILGGLLIGVAALWFGRSGKTTRRRLVAMMQFVLVVGAILLVCLLAYRGINSYFADKATLLGPDSGERKSIWMPRYVAIVWPPMAIILSVLLMRIPTRPLRWLAVLFLVAINLVQFGARIYAGTEAPLAQITADMMAGRTSPQVVTYVEDRPSGASPGTANIQSLSGSYYIARVLDKPFTPFEVRRLYPLDMMGTPDYRYPAGVAQQINRDRAVTHVIVWAVHPADRPVRDDGLARLLGNEWVETDNQIHHVRAFWNWAEFYQYQRREYERKPQKPE